MNSRGEGGAPSAALQDARAALPRTVVFRDEDSTEMRVPNQAGARAFAKQLIRKGKGFKCEPCSDEGWTITVFEYNWPSRWEDH